jgi:GH25 family lysozyme M1 (1,4-beta-N-acetylmuramidase)
MHRLRLALPRAAAIALALAILPLAAGTASASTNYVSNCGVNLRARPSTSSTIRKVIPVNAIVSVGGTVTGGSWKADCRTAVHGSGWFKVIAINGKSVSSMLGVSTVYAAVGLFRPGSSGTTEGVDISNWQGVVDFAKVKASGRQFVIAKATEGTTWTDASYARNRSAALAAGLRVTGYHFAQPDSSAGDAVREADHFIAVLGLTRGMLVPVLDLERTGGLGVSAMQAWTKAFLGRIYSRLGVRAMIYTSQYFWQTYMGGTTWFAANGYRSLWVASWHVTSPKMPASNWGGLSWTVWQYSSCGSVPGISGCVDVDRLKGSDFSGLTY